MYEERCLIVSRSTLFVSNLPYTATSTDLNTLFSDLAPVRSAFVVLEPGSGVSKGVGYVSFAIREDAQLAFDKIAQEGLSLDGRQLRAQWADSSCSMVWRCFDSGDNLSAKEARSLYAHYAITLHVLIYAVNLCFICTSFLGDTAAASSGPPPS